MIDCPERAEGGVPVTHPPGITGHRDTEEPLKVLHRGFDGLDVAFQGALRSEDLAILNAARERAEKELDPQLVTIGPGRVAMHVKEHGAKGGYRFVCDTGFLGAIWFFKPSLKLDGWNIRVSMKSLPLALFGINKVRELLYETLKALGVIVRRESLGRIDFAIDFLMPAEFDLKPEQFVAHSRSTKEEHDGFIREERISPDEAVFHFAGRRASTVTVGKQPGRQVIVYDKEQEIKKSQKPYWIDIWGLDAVDENCTVWRVELRSGKKHLKHWCIRTFDDLMSQFGDLILNSVQAIRYVLPGTADKNITRRPLHPLWIALEQECRRALLESCSGVVPGRIISGERDRIRAGYVAQISALVPGALVALGCTENQLDAGCDELWRDVLNLLQSDPKKTCKKFENARDRLHFILTPAGSCGGRD